MTRLIEFRIEHGDILNFSADVVAMKFAQAFYGVDQQIASAVTQRGVALNDLRPGNEGDFCYVDTRGGIRAGHVLYVSVTELFDFGYREIREFAKTVLQILQVEAPETRHLAMTIHGVGYGLDEIESLLAQFSGYLEAIEFGAVPDMLERISIVDFQSDRIKRLRAGVEQSLPDSDFVLQDNSDGWAYQLQVETPQRRGHARAILPPKSRTVEIAGAESEEKPHVFVAMPFRKDMDDVFYYGIQGPVRQAGFLCERVDQEAFTGEIMARVRKRIETAAVIIAELSGANPNVYLEVGYAWGKERPTILLIKDEHDLRFDVRGQRSLTYERIKDLEEALTKELEGLKTQGVIEASRKTQAV
jgi:hypothetical protein